MLQWQRRRAVVDASSEQSRQKRPPVIPAAAARARRSTPRQCAAARDGVMSHTRIPSRHATRSHDAKRKDTARRHAYSCPQPSPVSFVHAGRYATRQH